MVRDQLHVAGLEVHVEPQRVVARDLLVERHQLISRALQGGTSGVGPRSGSSRCARRCETPAANGGRAGSEPGTRALALLVARVEPEWLVEPLGELGSAREDLVVDRDASW